MRHLSVKVSAEDTQAFCPHPAISLALIPLKILISKVQFSHVRQRGDGYWCHGVCTLPPALAFCLWSKSTVRGWARLRCSTWHE